MKMFASLKNKIKEETGNEVPALPASAASSARLSISSRYSRGRLSSSASVTSMEDGQSIEKDLEILSMRGQCNELQARLDELINRIKLLEDAKENCEKANNLLLESVKALQQQKNAMSVEHEKINDIQSEEINRLKTLLSFREQEALDRLSVIKQNQQQIENLKADSDRLKMIEPIIEDLQDEVEHLKHSSQLDKNNLTTTLAAIEEENRNLKSRLQIVEQSRLEVISSLKSDEKVQALSLERKLLEKHLEEAYSQLTDIKSSWSGQNLALETQLSRLSNQVAEETTEKRKAIKERDDIAEKVKTLEFELGKLAEEVEHRNNKIKLLEEEIDEISSTLRETKLDSETEITTLKSQAESSSNEINDLKNRLKSADERLNEHIENSDQIAQALRKQNTILQGQLNEMTETLEKEKQEKLTALLRNAEISQSEEILKRDLRLERDDFIELTEKQRELKKELRNKTDDISTYTSKIQELNSLISSQNEKIKFADALKQELNEKNKTIKILNQRLTDLKKTLQHEIKCNKSGDGSGLIGVNSIISTNKYSENEITRTNGSIAGDGSIVMDEVNFKYLRHVIVKFLTSREVEARHLIRAVATLLQLSHEEEKLLHDTLNWKMSWFGSKPDHGRGQKAFSIPPS